MFEASEIDLLVKVSVVARPTNVSVASGRVSVRSAVGSVTKRLVSKSLAVAPSNTTPVFVRTLMSALTAATPFAESLAVAKI